MTGWSKVNERLRHDPKLDVIRCSVSPNNRIMKDTANI